MSNITISSNDSDEAAGDSCYIEHPAQHGYRPLRNCSYGSDLSDDGVEFATDIQQRQRCEPANHYGCSFDECEDAASSFSSDDLSYEGRAGIPESGSQYLYSSDPVRDTYLQVDNDYDEEHVVETSSSDTSPRDEADHHSSTLTSGYAATTSPLSSGYAATTSPLSSGYTAGSSHINKYSKYTASSHTTRGLTSSTSAASVDDGINFSISARDNSNFNTPRKSEVGSRFSSAPSTYSYRQFAPPSQHEDQAYEDGPSVRGMRVGSGATATPDDVRLDMSADSTLDRDISADSTLDLSKYVPGGRLHKQTTSRITRDGSPMLNRLDRPSCDTRSTTTYHSGYGSSGQESGYDDRFGERSSLEHQHPDRAFASGSIGDSSTTSRSHLTGSANGKPQPSYGTMSSEAISENAELNKKKERRDKKKKKTWKDVEVTDDNVGDKKLDEILAFLGEEDSPADSGKKKKDKKEKKKEFTPSADKRSDKRVTAPASYKKTDTPSHCTSTGKAPANTAESTVVRGEDGEPSDCTTTIIQTTSNNCSRIILNGNENVASVDLDTVTAADIDGKFDALSEINMTEPIGGSDTRTAEPQVVLVETADAAGGQNISATFNIDLHSPWVEEEFVMVPTPESVEEEFKEVVHKKKKGHTKVTAAVDQETTNVTYNDNLPLAHNKLNNKVSNRPKPLAEPKPPPSVSVPAQHGHRKPVEVKVKPMPLAAAPAVTTEYDLSETSFPMLSADNYRHAKVATVQPFTWADKVATKQGRCQQQQQPTWHSAVGSGDHCTSSEAASPAVTVHTELQQLTCNEMASSSQCGEGPLVAAREENEVPVAPGAIYEPIVEVEGAPSVDGESESSPATDSSCRHPAPSDGASSLLTTSPTLPPVLTNSTKHKAVADHKKTTKSTVVVEFVGKLSEQANAPSPVIRFGFGFGDVVDFDFGIEPEILESIRNKVDIPTQPVDLPTQPVDLPVVQPLVQPVTTSTSDGEGGWQDASVDILPQLLELCQSRKTVERTVDGSYPASLRKVVRMLKKEWDSTCRELHSGRHRGSGGKVVRWTPDLDS